MSKAQRDEPRQFHCARRLVGGERVLVSRVRENAHARDQAAGVVVDRGAGAQQPLDGDRLRRLPETDRDAFGLDAAAFTWRDRSASGEEIARVRRELFHSIGSCSFFEPVEELEALRMLSR